MKKFSRDRGFGKRESGRDTGRPDRRDSGRFERRDSDTPDRPSPRRFERRGPERQDRPGSGRFERGSERPGRGGSGRFERRVSDRPDRSERRDMHDVTCDECGASCKVPFRPTEGKPVYCSDCFRKGGNSGAAASPGISKKEFDKLNEKLDKIMKALKIN